MIEFFDSLLVVLLKHDLITAFAVVGAIVWLAYQVSDRLTQGRLHGSAIAILKTSKNSCHSFCSVLSPSCSCV